MHHTHHNPYPRPRAPVALILVVTLLALAVLAGTLGWMAWQFQQLPPGVAAVLRVAVFAVPLVLAGAAGVVGLIAAYNRWARPEIIKADKTIALTRATVQRFPDALTSLSFHDSSKTLPAPPVEEAEPLALPPPSVPSFSQLLDAGKVGPGRPLLLGFDAASGQAIKGSWKDLYSCGLGGMTGSGKSWAAAFLVGQSAAAGARLIVIDPHAGDAESLATRIAALESAFMCDVAQTPDQITAALKLASDKLEARKAGRGGSWPLLLVVDEWTSLLRGSLGDLLTRTALDVAEQGRKFGVFALLAAQAWQIDAAGPVRDRLASHYVLRQRPDQVRYQLGLRGGQLPLDVRFLQDAEAYMLTVRGDLTKVQIPQMTPADLAHIGAMIAQPAAAVGSPFGFHRATAQATTPAATVANGKPDGSLMVASANQATTAAGSGKSASPEATRAAALFVAGSSPAEIAKELRGVGSHEGRRYQAALNEVLDLIRQGMKGA